MEELNRRIAELGGPLAVTILDHLLSVAGALIVLAIGLTLAKWADRAVRRTLLRLGHVDRTLGLLLANLARYGITLVTLLATLAQFGVQTTSFLAVLGAAGLAIGLALQGTLQNVAAGVMLLIIRPFRVGEQIEAYAGAALIAAGEVRELSLFTTEIKTADDVFLLVPNAQLWNASIRNTSRHYVGFEQVTLAVAVPLDADPAEAMAVVDTAARATPEIQNETLSVQIVGVDGALRIAITARVGLGRGAETKTLLAGRVLTALKAAGMKAV
jgi:small conductance mechanosensitive channel